jgi:hypothetical protein
MSRQREIGSQRTLREQRIARSAQSRRAAIVETLENRQLLSSSWFVATSGGSDLNPGTLALPFKTIQAAANVAQSGDHVEIETGIYHETVTPMNSGSPGAPIVFEPYNNEKVTVSGADAITGWVKYSGNIYKAPMPWDLNTGNNQIFVDAKALVDARWPNTNYADPSHPTNATMTSVKVTSAGHAIIYNASLSQAAGYWTGAVIHMNPGQAWEDQTGWVTASSPGSVTISYTPGLDKNSIPVAGNKFYLWGKFKALDAPGEFYRDPTTNTLYAWMPASDSPTLHSVQAKHRTYAFNVSTVHDITIQGLGIFASAIRTTTASTDIVVNKVYVKYVTQALLAPIGYWIDPTDGIFMRGANSVVENTTVAFSSGDGIIVAGNGSTVHNNVVHDVAYVGTETAGIRSLADNVMIDHNTVYNSGRHGISALGAKNTVTYNTVHDVGLQTTEAGGIYSTGSGNTPSNGIVSYNYVYNIHTGGYGGTAIFLDNYSSNWVVHNNSTYNVD